LRKYCRRPRPRVAQRLPTAARACPPDTRPERLGRAAPAPPRTSLPAAAGAPRGGPRARGRGGTAGRQRAPRRPRRAAGPSHSGARAVASAGRAGEGGRGGAFAAARSSGTARRSANSAGAAGAAELPNFSRRKTVKLQMESLPECVSHFIGWGRISVSIPCNLFVFCPFGNEDPKTHNRRQWNDNPLYATDSCAEWFN
jgi:hypothetical protein